MKEFAEKFYKSDPWRWMRSYVYKRDNGLCQLCGEPGEEVHHTIELNESNIDDPQITLNPELLVLLCRSCHRKVTFKSNVVRDGCAFDEDGYLVDLHSPH